MHGFIINPASGNGRGAVVWKSVERALRDRKLPYEAAFTTGPGDATAIAQRMARQETIQSVTAVGGDGTANEAAFGLFGTDVPMGHIPAGSGNDFARNMRLPLEPLAALDVVLRGRVDRIDLGRAGHRIFVNSVGCGFDGEVAKATEQAPWKSWMNRLRLGGASYALSVLTVLFRFRPFQATIEVDGEARRIRDVWMVVTANLPCYGGGMRICPGASPRDGTFQVCVVHGLTRTQLIRNFPRIYRGTHVALPYVTMLEGKRVTVRGDRPLVAQVDGEYAEWNDADVVVLDRALAVVH